MLKLSKKTDYAIILLTHLGEEEVPVSAQEVATHQRRTICSDPGEVYPLHQPRHHREQQARAVHR